MTFNSIIWRVISITQHFNRHGNISAPSNIRLLQLVRHEKHELVHAPLALAWSNVQRQFCNKPLSDALGDRHVECSRSAGVKIREDIHDSVHCKQRAHDVKPLKRIREIRCVADAGEECVEDEFVCCGEGRRVYAVEKGVDFELKIHFDLM